MTKDPLVSLRGDRAKFPLLVRAAGRYFITGAPLRGAGDNATFLHRATVDYRARPYLTLSAPIWRRLARRHAAVTAPALLAGQAAFTGSWGLLLAWWALLVLLVSAWFGRRVFIGVRHYRGNRNWVDPAARTLYQAVGARYVRREARRAIQLPPDWNPAERQQSVRIVVPTDKALTATQQRHIVTAVGGRLGVLNPSGTWHLAGPVTTVDISGTPMPPKVVTLEMLREAIEDAPLTQPVVGWGADGPEYIDLEQDSPHVAVSGAAGTGKSTLLRLLLPQRMRHGVGTIMLDSKRWSHRWMHKLPSDRCQYWWRIPDIHSSLVAVGEELHRRIACDEDELGTFRELDVVVEEINSLIKMLATYWRGERKRIMSIAKAAQKEDMDFDEADLDPPLLSPAIAALQFGVNMGRELQIHFWVAAQRLEANVFGSNSGAAVRQSFALRLMAQWDRALWKMLASGHDYVAWPGGPRGLWGFVQDTVFKIIRVPNVATSEAIELAISGVATYGQILGAATGHVPMATGQPAVAKPAAAAMVTLAEALPLLPGQPMKLASLQRASRRPGFPPAVGQRGVAKLYDPSALIYWREGVLQLGSPLQHHASRP